MKIECPHCREEICDDEAMLLIGEQAYHRNCGLRGLISPAMIEPHGMTLREEADSVVPAWEKKRRKSVFD